MSGVARCIVRCSKESSKDRQGGVATRTTPGYWEACAGDNRGREAYKLTKQINRSWKPKQSALKDKNGKMLQGKEKVKQRWTEYCSGLYTDSGNSDTVIAALRA